jgi:nicotinate-nucleotide adenylyltransferase
MPAPSPGQRWGILGGVFDPVHLGHLTLARDVRSIRHLQGILFVPTFQPPHRPSPPKASFEDRMEMVRLALCDQPDMEVSRIEEQTTRPSFTLDTVQALKVAYPGVEFELIVGADQLSQLPTWHRWRELLDEVRLVVGCRPGAVQPQLPDSAPERILILESSLVDLSSTQVRAGIEGGATLYKLTALVPQAVAEYIIARDLYR